MYELDEIKEVFHKINLYEKDLPIYKTPEQFARSIKKATILKESYHVGTSSETFVHKKKIERALNA